MSLVHIVSTFLSVVYLIERLRKMKLNVLALCSDFQGGPAYMTAKVTKMHKFISRKIN